MHKYVTIRHCIWLCGSIVKLAETDKTHRRKIAEYYTQCHVYVRNYTFG